MPDSPSKRRRLRSRALLTALAVACLVGLAGAVAPQAPSAAATPVAGARAAASSFAGAVVAGINAQRRRNGLRPLRASAQLAAAAANHARSMEQAGYFGHSSQDGTSASARIRRFYPGSAVGEAMLWRSPGITAAEVVRTWLSSPAHRAILLHPRFREVGIATARASRAAGVFGVGPATIVVADFGAR